MASEPWQVRAFLGVMMVGIIVAIIEVTGRIAFGWFPVRESPLDTGEWTRPPAPPAKPAWPAPRKPGEGWAHQTAPIEPCPCGWPCVWCHVWSLDKVVK